MVFLSKSWKKLLTKQGKEECIFWAKYKETLAAPRPDLKPNAPHVETIVVPKRYDRCYYDPGGKIIQAIQFRNRCYRFYRKKKTM